MQGLLAGTSEPLIVSTLAIAEVGSAVSRRQRMGDLVRTEGEQALAAFDKWIAMAATVEANRPEDIALAGRLVRQPRPKLLTSDAIHPATCLRLGLPMVTEDRALLPAAHYHGVKTLVPTDA